MDKIDKKILFELDNNCRQTLKDIGGKVRLSQQAVEKRINKMIDKGIVNSFQTIIAYQLLGYTTYIIYLRLQGTSIEIEEKIIEKLKLKENIIALWRCEGIYDLMLGIQAKDVFELNKIIIDLNNNLGKFIQNYEIVTNVGAEHYARYYLIDKKGKGKLFLTGGESNISKLDKEDLIILKKLISKPRINFVELASETKLTLDIVRYRFRKLLNKNILQGFSIVLNPRKSGFLHYRILFKLKNIDKSTQNKIFDFAHSMDNIRMITKSFGVCELTLDIEVENADQLRAILTDFRNKFKDHIYHYDILNIYAIDKYITLAVSAIDKKK